jgi:Glycosyl transferase family 2
VAPSRSDALGTRQAGDPLAAEPPAVTIPIVTRGPTKTLRGAVHSALEQEGSIEVLVIDDGSRDGTSESALVGVPSVASP